MNKFTTLFVLSLLMLGMKSHTMEKKTLNNPQYYCYCCNIYNQFLHDVNEKTKTFVHKEVENMTNFFEQENNNKNNLVMDRTKTYYKFASGQTKITPDISNFINKLEKIGESKQNDLVHIVMHTIHVEKVEKIFEPLSFLQIALGLIRNRFPIKIQKIQPKITKKEIIIMTYFKNPTSKEQITSAYSYIGKILSGYGFVYGKDKVDCYNNKNDKKAIVRNRLLKIQKDNFYLNFLKMFNLNPDNDSKEKFNTFHKYTLKNFYYK